MSLDLDQRDPTQTLPIDMPNPDVRVKICKSGFIGDYLGFLVYLCKCGFIGDYLGFLLYLIFFLILWYVEDKDRYVHIIFIKIFSYRNEFEYMSFMQKINFNLEERLLVTSNQLV